MRRAEALPRRRQSLLLAWLGLVTIIVAALSLQPVRAADDDQTWSLGDYVVHANAMRTDFLAPEVARKLGIERRDDRGMLTVSVKEKGDDPQPENVEAEVRTTTTIEDQRRTVNMEAHGDDEVTYYIGTFPIRHRQQVTFDVQVEPITAEQTYSLTFDRVFFTR
jgi:hypothetical protein